ncbi:uncharacterized protein LOC106665114 [Cimex lectularius]|uniref:Uncharacterized protein n=1 Tax=Cimex lectularius TaxID=79782 RepID=A0A8I6RIF8_CIMLE|nr:uncharacterized protein LOC106665114 [Cimex lectularius]XP_014246811.1 uncharacterized protein LOC106665114 [Cimex lectularius]
MLQKYRRFGKPTTINTVKNQRLKELARENFILRSSRLTLLRKVRCFRTKRKIYHGFVLPMYAKLISKGLYAGSIQNINRSSAGDGRSLPLGRVPNPVTIKFRQHSENKVVVNVTNPLDENRIINFSKDELEKGIYVVVGAEELENRKYRSLVKFLVEKDEGLCNTDVAVNTSHIKIKRDKETLSFKKFVLDTKDSGFSKSLSSQCEDLYEICFPTSMEQDEDDDSDSYKSALSHLGSPCRGSDATIVADEVSVQPVKKEEPKEIKKKKLKNRSTKVLFHSREKMPEKANGCTNRKTDSVTKIHTNYFKTGAEQSSNYLLKLKDAKRRKMSTMKKSKKMSRSFCSIVSSEYSQINLLGTNEARGHGANFGLSPHEISDRKRLKNERNITSVSQVLKGVAVALKPLQDQLVDLKSKMVKFRQNVPKDVKKNDTSTKKEIEEIVNAIMCADGAHENLPRYIYGHPSYSEPKRKFKQFESQQSSSSRMMSQGPNSSFWPDTPPEKDLSRYMKCTCLDRSRTHEERHRNRANLNRFCTTYIQQEKIQNRFNFGYRYDHYLRNKNVGKNLYSKPPDIPPIMSPGNKR